MTNYPTEAEEQITVVEWCAANGVPVFHIPNGGERRKAVAVYLQRQGVKPGVPDLFIPVARGRYHGLFVEMKRRKQWKVSEKQKEWLLLLKEQGYATFICPGADNAIACISQYMDL